MQKDLISIYDLTKEDIEKIFDLSKEIKEKLKKGEEDHPLEGKTLGMIFTKPSTRTRISFEVGIFQLGGIGLYFSAQDLQLKRGETIADTAKVLSRYLDGIMIRTFDHNDVVELGKYASIPVINGLTDLLHPCQILTDIYTIYEKKGKYQGLKVVYVGDGNNVCNSWLYGAAKTGINFVVACPKGYEPDKKVQKEAKKDAEASGGNITILEDSNEAVKEADVIYTDVWASMGQEEEHEKRVKLFQPYQINQKLVVQAKPDVLVMHCLPAHRGEEITDEVIDGPHSIVFDEAENRLHLQKAIMVLLMGK